MEVAYVLVQCKMAHEMEVLKELLEIDWVKEAKGTFGYYDILVKIEAENASVIEQTITKNIRTIPNVTTTTTISIIPEQGKDQLAKETRRIDKKGFSNKFFEELDKEHDNAKNLADRQKDLKQKHQKKESNQSVPAAAINALKVCSGNPGLLLNSG